MVAPRFTIARGMNLVLLTALVVAAVRRTFLGVYFCGWIGFNAAFGWVAWLKCRHRPGVVPLLYLAILLGSLPLSWVGSLAGRLSFLGWYCVFIVLAYPVIVGAGVAWLSAPRPAQWERGWSADLLVLLIIITPSCPILPLYLLTLLALLFNDWSREMFF